MYATDAVDKADVKPMDVIVVDQDTCEDSTGWSDSLEGETYEDLDDGIQNVQYVADSTGKRPTYETISYEVYHHYTRLCEDPDQWAADQEDPWA